MRMVVFSMPSWLFLIIALVVQETATATVAFTSAMNNHIPIWAIHILWASFTIFDAYVGFRFGHLIRNHYRNARVVRWAERIVEKLRGPLGKYGGRFLVTVLALINFPYVASFIASWLGIEMRTSVLFTFIGNAIWYVLLWVAILGADTFLKGPAAVIFVIVVVSVLFYFAKNTLEKRT